MLSRFEAVVLSEERPRDASWPVRVHKTVEPEAVMGAADVKWVVSEGGPATLQKATREETMSTPGRVSGVLAGGDDWNLAPRRANGQSLLRYPNIDAPPAAPAAPAGGGGRKPRLPRM